MVQASITIKSAKGSRISAIADSLLHKLERTTSKWTDDKNKRAAKMKKQPVRSFSKQTKNTKETNKTSKNANALNSSSRKIKANSCKVVSPQAPQKMEECTSSARSTPETIPSSLTDSEDPNKLTPNTIIRIVKENWPVPDMLSDVENSVKSLSCHDGKNNRNMNDGPANDPVYEGHQVNADLNRAAPMSMSPPVNPVSARKLSTARADGEDAENTPPVIKRAKPNKDLTRPNKAPKRLQKERTRFQKAIERQKKLKFYYMTQELKRNLESVGRLAKKIAGNPAKGNIELSWIQRSRTEGSQTQNRRIEGTQTEHRRISNIPRIVLSGMSKSQYQAVLKAIQTLKGIVQKQVNHDTTHVLLGSCKEDLRPYPNIDGLTQDTTNSQPELSAIKTLDRSLSLCNQCNKPEYIMQKINECDNVKVTNHCWNPANVSTDLIIICKTVNRNANVNEENVIDLCDDTADVGDGVNSNNSLRTLKTLLGAARGCRVLHAQWALDSLKEKSWVPYIGYEVTHLKIAERARIERSAIGKMHSEYGYNVFRGLRVRVTATAGQRDAALQLLTLCGAVLVQGDDVTQHGGPTQNGRRTQHGRVVQLGDEFDNSVTVVGKGEEEVCSKWVFDSVAAGRPKAIQGYVNKKIVPSQF